MNSSDLRLVRLIPITGEGSFSRASEATYFDAAGVLQTAPPNTLRVTYDPADLSKAPYALVEPEETNLLPNAIITSGSVWSSAGVTQVAISDVLSPQGTASAYKMVEGSGPPPLGIRKIRAGGYGLTTDDLHTFSVFAKAAERSQVQLQTNAYGGHSFRAVFDLVSGTFTGPFGGGSSVDYSAGMQAVGNGWFRIWIRGIPRPNYGNGGMDHDIFLLKDNAGNYEGDGVSGVYLFGPNITRGQLSSYISSTGAPVTRAADVVGPGAGLVYSNVPITEPLWVAGTYAPGAKVRDAQNFVFESLAAGNTAQLTDKTKWLPLGVTNRWKAFDKAVNSQTTAPGMLTFSLKPGTVATTLMLLNMEGASVTVSQSDSGYVSTQNLVSHEVDNWYDFYYEEPVRAGDAVFTDIPPYPNSMLTVSIDNGPLESKIGACLVGKPLVLGKVTASFSAGVLSYSTSTTDTFGNITMVKRSNAPRMNFDVMIPTGSEDFAYRTLRDFTDTEIGIIVGDRFSMGIGYGFLGQWDVPKSGSGRTASIEFKGLV